VIVDVDDAALLLDEPILGVDRFVGVEVP